MTELTAADVSRIYNELTEATSPMTAEVLVHGAIATRRDDLVTNDHLDLRLAEIDARFAEMNAKMDAGFARLDARIERSMRQQLVWLLAAMFTFNGLLATWLTAFT